MKTIVLLSTGGTIASTAGADGKSVAGALPGEQLLKQVQLSDTIDLQVRSLFQKPSNAIALPDLCQLHDECRRLAQSGDVAGIVITHGTDTLEETAGFLDSVLSTENVPVVITGSQRVPHAPGTDAYLNLQHAIEVAASDEAHDMGVLVVFNETIFSAATVRKVSSYQVNGFDSPGLGALGLIDQGRIILQQRPVRRPVIALPDGLSTLPTVEIVPAYLDAGTTALDAVIASSPRGIVIDALGRGHVPPGWMPSIQHACGAGIMVIVCTSTLHGPLWQSYDFAGSLQDLEATGAVPVSGLPARKARVRLAALLAAGNPDEASLLQL